MTLLFVSFLAGVLTVLAPCILPLLPVVVGSSVSRRSAYTPYVVIGSLALSVVLFTFLLKATTTFIAVPALFWSILSGGVVVLFGLTLIAPNLWGSLPLVRSLNQQSNTLLGTGYTKKSFFGDMLIGGALGPVFSTCSPTYFLILATVLPASVLLGTLYLFAFVLGLSLVLLCIVWFGDLFVSKLLGVSASYEKIKKYIGVLLLLVGFAIMFGFDKKFEAYLLETGIIKPTNIEYKLLEQVTKTPAIEKDIVVVDAQPEEAFLEESTIPSVTEFSSMVEATEETPIVAVVPKNKTPVILPTTAAPTVKTTQEADRLFVELKNPDGYLNTDGKAITIAGALSEHKAILVTFITYSCINCQRTFDHLNNWYETYRDDGLEIIGIHTPEFSYEKKIDNVREALKKEGIEFPVVLDNDYETWNAYENRYWPRRYLIDPKGNVVFDHIGEGAYGETEENIKILLNNQI